MAAPPNQAANLLLDDPFPQTHAFIQLVGLRAEQDVAFNPLFLALHQLNATIMMNEAFEIDEETLVAQFVAVPAEAIALGPLIAAEDAVLAAYNAFQMELLAFMGNVHLISKSHI